MQSPGQFVGANLCVRPLAARVLPGRHIGLPLRIRRIGGQTHRSAPTHPPHRRGDRAIRRGEPEVPHVSGDECVRPIAARVRPGRHIGLPLRIRLIDGATGQFVGANLCVRPIAARVRLGRHIGLPLRIRRVPPRIRPERKRPKPLASDVLIIGLPNYQTTCLSHSNLNASIGFNRAARSAGYNPATSPTNADTPVASKIVTIEMLA